MDILCFVYCLIQVFDLPVHFICLLVFLSTQNAPFLRIVIYNSNLKYPQYTHMCIYDFTVFFQYVWLSVHDNKDVFYLIEKVDNMLVDVA